MEITENTKNIDKSNENKYRIEFITEKIFLLSALIAVISLVLIITFVFYKGLTPFILRGYSVFDFLFGKEWVPSAVPGILSGLILSIGRVIGESADILLTAGTVAQMPRSIFESARTLTVQSYLVTKEKGNIQEASAIGIVLIVIILISNTLAKLVTKKFNKANY